MSGRWSSDVARGSNIANRAVPANLRKPPAKPLIAPTGSASLDTVLDVINRTAAPFTNAPPPEQGTAGKFAERLGAVLGVVGAPEMLLDTAAAVYLPEVPLVGKALKHLSGPLPAATALTTLHAGIAHAHAHPPSLGAPLLSVGLLLGPGAVTVLMGGLPAARLGDIGLAVTCGGLSPPFEVATGSSNVFVGGARAARMFDLTRVCAPSSFGPFSAAMSAAGVAVGAANAVETSSPHAAMQAAADAGALALRMLMGKDPGAPPGMGMLIPLRNVRVEIGGAPCPSMGAVATGLMRGLSKLKARIAERRSARRGNGCCGNAGHPVYLVTGENFDAFTDFVSGGLFEMRRHYTSARWKADGPLGLGWRHFYQRSLTVRLHRATFTDWDGDTVVFPRFERGADVTRAEGYVLKRLRRGHYRLSFRHQPAMEFEGQEFQGDLPLTRLCTDDRVLELEYDEQGRLAGAVERVHGADECRHFEWDYDADCHIVRLIERSGFHDVTERATYRYANRLELTAVEDASGAQWAYEYNGYHRLTKSTDPRGYSFMYRYDIHGRCIETAGMDGLWRAKMEYFPEQRKTRWTEGDGNPWELHYDAEGFITKVLDPYGGKKTRDRDPEGTIVREVDAAGRELHWLYDAEGAHHARADRFGNLYPPEGEMPELKNPFARRLPANALGWHFTGAVTVSEEALRGASRALLTGVPWQLFDAAMANFRLQSSADPPLLAPHVEYDLLGRKVHETDQLGRTRHWTYDDAGNLIAETDRDGRTTTRTVSSWNLVGAVTDPLGSTMRYEYSSSGKVIGIIDPMGNASRYEYDAKQRLVRVHRHGRLRDEYVYDQGDRLIEKRDDAGNILFRNDIHRNHFVAVRHLASGGVHRFDYAHDGRIVKASTEDHDVRLSYSDGGPPISDMRDGVGVEHRPEGTTWRTSVLGRFELSTTTAARSVELVDACGGRTTIEHDPSGWVRRTSANGTVELLQFNADGRLAARFAYRRDRHWELRTWTVQYTYTAEGDLIQADDSARGTTHYGVDAAHRLAGEIDPSGKQDHYWQDEAGNLLWKPGTGRLARSEGNRLTYSKMEKFEYDSRDRIATREHRDGSVIHYTYDSFDMLVGAVRVGLDGVEGPRWTASYDAIGRRIWAQRGDQKREFYWDGDRLAAEVFPEGRLRVYQYPSRQALVPISFIEYPDRDADPTAGRVYQVFSDPTGLPLAIEDASGEVVWWAERADPYGPIRVREGATIGYNLRWPGHYYDPETGLHYNRYRYYDPGLGRYLQPDPLGYEGSPINLYAYCPNPLVQVDILGLSGECGGAHGNGAEAGPGDHTGAEPAPVAPGRGPGTQDQRKALSSGLTYEQEQAIHRAAFENLRQRVERDQPRTRRVTEAVMNTETNEITVRVSGPAVTDLDRSPFATSGLHLPPATSDIPPGSCGMPQAATAARPLPAQGDLIAGRGGFFYRATERANVNGERQAPGYYYRAPCDSCEGIVSNPKNRVRLTESSPPGVPADLPPDEVVPFTPPPQWTQE